ncbi:MAG: hypothetical protein Q7W13_13230 [Bacteroidia bacterium]|nr:hypothetical protein [Bacteroidia bacterium]
MSSKTTQCELEKKIFEYKLKEIRAWRTSAFIVEVNGQTVCLNRNSTMVLVDEPFPTEFTHVELHHLKKVITGAEPKVYSVREWYKSKLEQLSMLMLIIREDSI